MIAQAHELDTGCFGPVEATGMHASRSDRDTLSAECNGCGAVFGGLTIDKPSSLEVTHDSYSASQLASLDWVPSTTFYANMTLIVEAMDDLFNEEMARQREKEYAGSHVEGSWRSTQRSISSYRTGRRCGDDKGEYGREGKERKVGTCCNMLHT